MKNLLIAKKFREVADILEFEGIAFKPQAYRRAALKIENFNFDICEIGGIRELMELPGVGEAIAQKIVEICETGELKYLQKLKKEIDVDLESLEKVEGIGPKKIRKLFEELNIKNLKDLKKAALAGQIKDIEGFGETTEKKIIQNIKQVETRQKRFVYGQIGLQVNLFLEKLKEFPEVDTAEVAGSFRRHKETIGDLDILVVTQHPEKLSQRIAELKEVENIVGQGLKKMSFDLDIGLRVDIRFVDAESFGSALLYFTGNKDFNINLRKIAIAKNWKLNEYGLFAGTKSIAGKTEEEIFTKLGLHYIPPECREDTGEIEIAKKRDFDFILPERLPLGNVHLHTRFSDGEGLVQEMAQKAISMGFKYIAISDHAGTLAVAHPVKDDHFDDYLEKIEEIDKKYPKIKILKAAEVNIMANGELDLEEKWLKKLDLVIGSIHSGVSGDSVKNTERYMKALDNPYLNIIAHPTGRRFNLKEGMELDYRKIFEKAKLKKVAFEINATPDRIDLPVHLLKLAKEIGNKIVINTDSHTISSMENIWLGIYQARRAFLEESDVLNYLGVEEFLGCFR